MTRIWPTPLAAREGLASALASRWLAAILVLATAAISAAVGLANALDVSALVEQERRWIDAGAYVFVVEPSPESDTQLGVASCERLAAVEGIHGTFAVKPTGLAAHTASAPGASASISQVSPGIFRFFDIDPSPSGGVIITPGVADQTELTSSESTVLTVEAFDSSTIPDSTLSTVTTVTSPILGESIVGAYLFPDLLRGDAQQCYVMTDAPHVEYVQDYLAAALGGDRPALVRPRLAENTYGADFATAYSSRPLGWAWSAGALILVALWGLLRYSRRTPTAVYATFGVHARARLVMQMTEWLIMTGIGAAWGWATAVALAIGLHADASIAVTQITSQVGAAWCAASVGAVIVGLLPVGTLLDVLKERT